MRRTTCCMYYTAVETVVDIICFQIHNNPWIIIPTSQVRLKHTEILSKVITQQILVLLQGPAFDSADLMSRVTHWWPPSSIF